LSQLISDEYREMQSKLHENPNYGIASTYFAPIVDDILTQFKIKDLLDDWTEKFNNLDYALTYVETHLDEIQNNPLGKNKRNVWTITTKPFKDAHFATFPKDLIEPCIKAGCPEGGVVLDPFGGSGTTGIVAALNNRNAILIELNQNYIDIANKRIDKEVGLFSG